MARTAEALETHLRDDLIPWWRDHGVDRTSGDFHETLRDDGSPGPESERRLRTVTRQLYAFGVGARLGVRGARELAEMALDRLHRVLGDPEHGGFFRSATADGAPLDRSKDTYDHAFAVFALAEHHASCGDADALALAEQTAALVVSKLRDEAHGGYFEHGANDWTPQPTGARRQNPHMHWVEALLALHAGTGADRWLEEADSLVALCSDHFVDGHTGTLREHFGPGWEPLEGAEADAVEPGHHYEWAWLLSRYQAAGGAHAIADVADRLFTFAESSGLGEGGLVLDGVARDGRPIRRTHRLWPQAERMKALAARGELGRLRDFLELAFGAYAAPAGGWHEELGPDGKPTDARQRATSLYHVVLALLEARRALAAAPA